MTTAQQLLSQGNQTQQVQAVTNTVTSLAPWIAFIVLGVILAKIMFGGKNAR